MKLSTFISICYLLKYKYPIILLPIAWNLNFKSTVCYYIYMLMCKYGLSMDFTSLYSIILKNLSHGPHLLYLIPYIKHHGNPHLFNINTLLVTYFIAMLRFIFIYYPWYYLTGDSLYIIYSPKYTIINMLNTTLKISFIIIIGNYSGSFITN